MNNIIYYSNTDKSSNYVFHLQIVNLDLDYCDGSDSIYSEQE